MQKEYYRQQILKMKPYINVGAICSEIGISRQPMYYFLKGIDSAVSLETLKAFINFVDSL